mmetsp:Transcript_84568/g.226003  ORF Transcript_84568/g.226003 Transcript_84568/m.226003 type:complete len:248 (-) Transcript_84568:14-757(-)
MAFTASCTPCGTSGSPRTNGTWTSLARTLLPSRTEMTTSTTHRFFEPLLNHSSTTHKPPSPRCFSVLMMVLSFSTSTGLSSVLPLNALAKAKFFLAAAFRFLVNPLSCSMTARNSRMASRFLLSSCVTKSRSPLASSSLASIESSSSSKAASLALATPCRYRALRLFSFILMACSVPSTTSSSSRFFSSAPATASAAFSCTKAALQYKVSNRPRACWRCAGVCVGLGWMNWFSGSRSMPFSSTTAGM